MRTLLRYGLLLAHSALCAQTTLTVTGKAHLPASVPGALLVDLLTACGDTIATERTTTGDFRFVVHRRAAYRVSFHRADLITKEVVVEAAQLPELGPDVDLKSIRFDLVMDPGDPLITRQYSHPLGFARLRPKAGSMQVLYEQDEEPVANEVR